MFNNDYQDILDAQNGNKEKMTSLVINNMGLVYNITKRFYGRGFEMDDLNQIGTIGLIKAIKNFDSTYNVQLSTYSVPYILGEIKRFIRDDGKIKVSRGVKDLGKKINLLKKEYLNKYGEEIKIDKLSKILNESKEDILFAMDATASNVVTSINEPVYNDNEEKICLGDTLQSNTNQENEITNHLSMQKILNELNERERKIIVLRYYKGNTQTQVSKMLGISQVQISRIEKKVLIKMREKIS